MRLKVETVDIDKTKENWPLNTPFAPALVRPRENDKRVWHVLCEQLIPGQPPAWCPTAKEEFIRIPLFSYTTSHVGDLALAYMLQLGLTCAGYFPAAVTDLHIVTGRPVELIQDATTGKVVALRYWVGLAVIVDEEYADE